jgi:hypothetical protein
MCRAKVAEGDWMGHAARQAEAQTDVCGAMGFGEDQR